MVVIKQTTLDIIKLYLKQNVIIVPKIFFEKVKREKYSFHNNSSLNFKTSTQLNSFTPKVLRDMRIQQKNLQRSFGGVSFEICNHISRNDSPRDTTSNTV